MSTKHQAKTQKKSKKGRVKQVILWILTAIVAVLIVVTAVLLIWSPGKIEPILGADGNPLPGSISEIVRMNIGGVDQGMIIRGDSDKKPVLLFLHGGPGSPEYMMDRVNPTGLEKEFVVCWWDQRGAGMSFHSDIPKESMTLKQMVADTVEVTNYLRERFGQDKIYILGHSWGTVLGMHTIAAHPELYKAYIGTGQVADQLQSEQLAYAYMMKTALETGDTALVKKLEAFSINTPEDLSMEYVGGPRTAGMNKQEIGIMHKKISMFWDLVLPLLKTPEYTFGEKIGYARGGLFSLQTIWPVVAEETLMKTVPRVEVPVYILHGKYDYQVSYELAKKYSETLEAPEIHFYTFENSAHSPCFEEPELFMQILREDVLKK